MTIAPNAAAQDLFAPIAENYERWARILSLGQDPRWRAMMVAQLELPSGSVVLDVAAGTGAISRMLEARGLEVIALDVSRQMLARARREGATAVQARAEALPFPDESFDGLTFSYLLRYVPDVADCMRELVRVVRPGGRVGMVEFGRPRGLWGPMWKAYTRSALPGAGFLIGDGWGRVGRFLGPSIDAFHDRFPGDALTEVWREVGLVAVTQRSRSLGGGLIMSGRKA